MFEILKRWFQTYFSDPEAAILLIVILLFTIVILWFGNILAPILAGLVVAYLLEAVMSPLERYAKFPRWLALWIVFVLFIGLIVLALTALLPLLSKQLAGLVSEVPIMVGQFHGYLATLPQKYPDYIPTRIVQDLINNTSVNADKLSAIGQYAFSFSISSIPSIVNWLIYLFLVPLLALFFLKDKAELVAWCSARLGSRDRGLTIEVWHEMQHQLGNYVRGKVVEAVIVGIFTYVAFRVFNLNYAVLLAFFVGLSVIIPYVGMVVVTIPVAMVGLLQFGLSPMFAGMFVSYLIIQALDGNLLVPLLFAEAVNLHPVAIIAAVLFFGGIWGFWGLFFAIPLATLVKAVISGWYHHAQEYTALTKAKTRRKKAKA